jgi:sugar (pentulose or hexulose) kinase
VARAILEGVAHSVAHALSAYDDAGASIRTITAVGGLTRNPIVMSAVSALTGLDQRVATTSGSQRPAAPPSATRSWRPSL